MADEDIDDLVAAATPQSSAGGGDEDDEYENPGAKEENDYEIDDYDAEEIDDGTGPGTGAGDEVEDDDGGVVPTPAAETEDEEEEDDEEEEEDKKTYILFNRMAYYVPPSELGNKAGRIRDHNTCIEVPDAQTLGQMSNAKYWPRGNNLPPLAIVVVKGVYDESEVLNTDKNKGPFHWYARVVIKGNNNPTFSDSQILRPIPKTIVTEFLHTMAKLDHMKGSSLVTKYQPEDNNAKPFPVQPNGWKKVPGIKTEAVPMQRAKKEKPGNDAFEKAAAPATAEALNKEAYSSTESKPAMPVASKKPMSVSVAAPAVATSSSNKRPVSSPLSAPGVKKPKASTTDVKKEVIPTKSDKKPAPPVTAPPTLEIKKETAAALAPAPAAAKEVAMPQPPKKSCMLQFTKQAKAKPFFEAPVETATTAAPIPTAPPTSAPTVGSKRPAPSTEVACSKGANLSDVFKKVARVDCDSRDKTTVFWVGNSVFIGQY